MSTHRAARVDDGATVRLTKSVTPPLSTSRKLLSPANPLHSDKENINNLHRSTSRGSASNPTQKPVIRPVPRISTSSVPRGRTPGPTRSHKMIYRLSVDRVAKDPTHRKEKMDLNKLKVQTRSRSSYDGNGISKSEFKIESDGNNKKNEKNNKYQSKLHEKLAFLEGKVKRKTPDIKKTKEMLDMNNPDASKVILSDDTTTTTTTTNDDDDDDGVDEKKMKNKQLGMVDKRVLNNGLGGACCGGTTTNELSYTNHNKWT